MKKRQTRTETELQKGKKSLFAWIQAGNKEWLDAEMARQRRTLSATLDTLIEEVRARRQQGGAELGSAGPVLQKASSL